MLSKAKFLDSYEMRLVKFKLSPLYFAYTHAVMLVILVLSRLALTHQSKCFMDISPTQRQ